MRHVILLLLVQLSLAHTGRPCYKPCMGSTCGEFASLLTCSKSVELQCDCSDCCEVDLSRPPSPPPPPPPPPQPPPPLPPPSLPPPTSCFAPCLIKTCADYAEHMTCGASASLGCECSGCCSDAFLPAPPSAPPPPEPAPWLQFAEDHPPMFIACAFGLALVIALVFRCLLGGDSGRPYLPLEFTSQPPKAKNEDEITLRSLLLKVGISLSGLGLLVADIYTDCTVIKLLFSLGHTGVGALGLWFLLQPYVFVGFVACRFITRLTGCPWWAILPLMPLILPCSDVLMFLEPFGPLIKPHVPTAFWRYLLAYKATRMVAEVVLESAWQAGLQSTLFVNVMESGTAGAQMYDFARVVPTSILISAVVMLKTWIELHLDARKRGETVIMRLDKLAKMGGAAPSNANVGELLKEGFPLVELIEAGYISTCAQAKEAGFGAKEIREAGYTCKEARDAGALSTCAQAKAAGFVNGLKEAGFSATDAKQCGYSATEMREGGYTCKEARDAGALSTCAQAKEVGYTPRDAQQCGYSLPEMKQGGYTAAEFKAAGYTPGDCLNAGFTGDQIYAASNYWSGSGDRW